jgi:hypothetical protein
MTVKTGEEGLGGNFSERRRLRVARIALVGAITVLALLLLMDLLQLFVGRVMLADVFYLPLREIPLGEHREAVEQSIVRTSQKLPMPQHLIYLIAHAILLVVLCSVVRLIGAQRAAHGDNAIRGPDSTNV